MQAVILAGGLGIRLKPLTDDVPKPMVRVKGEPFLAHLLRLFTQQGIGEAVLCTGYLGKQIEEYFGIGDGMGIKIGYSREEEQLLGTGGAVKQAEGLLDDRFFLVNGDTYLPVDYPEMMETFSKKGTKAMMAVYRDTAGGTGVSSDVELDGGELVTAYRKGEDNHNSDYINAGVLVLKRQVISDIPSGRPVSLEKEVFPVLIEQGQIAAYETKQRFFDIGTFNGLRSFENYIGGDWR